MSDRIAARVSHRFQTATAEQVYDSWLDAEKVRRWMAAALQSFGLAGEIKRVEIDARIGGKFCFSDVRGGVDAKHWGTYLELERPRKIVFTWIADEADEANPSQVTLTIQPEEKGCTAMIVHEMDPKWADYVARVEGGWGGMLKQIELLLG